MAEFTKCPTCNGLCRKKVVVVGNPNAPKGYDIIYETTAPLGHELAEKIVDTEDKLLRQDGLILCPFCLHEIHLSPYHEIDCEYKNMLVLARQIIEQSKGE
jgi:hypothetical protein